MGVEEKELLGRIKIVEAEINALRRIVGGVATLSAFTNVEMHVFEGGRLPIRQTEGAIGYDAYARAIVDPISKPDEDNPLRRTMADFHKTDKWEERLDPKLQNWVIDDESDPSKYALVLPKGERVMVGLGFATSMTFPMLYWVAPRSGYAARGITVANSPGTVDPDYRGEAGALIENNSIEDFIISHHMRVVQIIFSLAVIPNFETVELHKDLSPTKRGPGGFGSTGTH